MKIFILLPLLLISSLSYSLSPKESYHLLNKTFGYVDLQLVEKFKGFNKAQVADFVINSHSEEQVLQYSWLDKVNFLMESGFHCFMKRKYQCDSNLKEENLNQNYINFKNLLNETGIKVRGVSPAQDLTLEEFQTHLTRGSGFAGRLSSKLYQLFQSSTLNSVIKHENGFADKLSFVFQNHFVSTLRESRSASMMHDQYNLIRSHIFGNLKDLVTKLTLDPAMLKYLDGDRNKCIKVDGKCQAPNENYARELMELFTLGVNKDNGAGNCYTEEDIKNAAQALTGYRVDLYNKEVTFSRKWSDFDKSNMTYPKKPLFTQSCHVKGLGDIEKADSYVTDTHSLTEVLFARRGKQIARFMTNKILSQFIDSTHPKYEDELRKIQKIFYNSNFELKEIYKSMLTSKLFFSEQNKLAHVRSPLEVFLGIYKMFSKSTLVKKNVKSMTHLFKLAKQDLFNQPDVKGWRIGYSWIDTSSYTYRLEIVNRTFSNLLPQICKKNPKAFKRKVKLFNEVFNIDNKKMFKNCNDLNKLKRKIIGTDFIQKR